MLYLLFNTISYLIQIIYIIYNLNKNIVNFLIFIMNNDINVHTMYFMTIQIILNMISIRIIIYYLIYYYSCKKWAINTRNETLLKLIKEYGIQSLRHL